LNTRILALALVAAASAPVSAGGSGKLGTVEMKPQPHAQAATTLYLNRCRGGCTIKKGGLSDARTLTSEIPNGPGPDFVMSEYAWGDGDWDSFMLCMREVYSPYGVTVTDTLPAPGIAFNEGVIAGSPGELGLAGFGGIAPITSDCSPYSYVISFTFANIYGAGNSLEICSVAAQETGHAFGLDHSYEYPDHRSACTDPMSYRGDCGGQRFFRNEAATCGEFQPRNCRCGPTQNTHLKLLNVLGPATPITRAPTISVTTPAPNAQIANGAAVAAIAGAQRGVKTVELYLNGYKWAQVAGAAFGPAGQPESAYSIPLPADVPDGVIDILVRAKDDIGIFTDAPIVTVTKGAPCTSADACAAGQLCEAGKCYWEPASGELGEQCTFEQFCLSGLCTGTASDTRCTQSCIPNSMGTCPDQFVCLPNNDNNGICWPQDLVDTGCACSSSSGAATQTALLAFALLLVVRRRRR
jgi:MYXO-CTERM domain-containing protein